MTQAPPGVATDHFVIMPLVASVLLITFAIVPQEALSAWINREGRFDLDLRLLDYASLVAALAAIAVFTRKAVTNLRRSRPKLSISYFSSAALIIFGLLFMTSLITFSQYPKLYLLSDLYEACKRRAESYSEGSAFHICTARVHGNAYQIVAYDSGKQIEASTGRQSDSFKEFLRLKVGPILSSCDVRASRINDSFYYVQADCG